LVVAPEKRPSTAAESIRSTHPSPAARAGALRDRARLGRLRHRLHRAQVLRQLARSHHALGLLVEELHVLLVDVGRLDGHRAVHEDGEGLEGLAIERAGQEEEQELRPADREDRHENPAAALDGSLHGLPRLDGGLVEGPVVAVAIGRFQEDEVCLLEGRRIAVQRRAPRADVAGEDDHLLPALLLDGDLEGSPTRARAPPRRRGR
jgi:hypothetical protein